MDCDCLGEFLLELLQKSGSLKIDFVVCNICRSWKLLPQSNWPAIIHEKAKIKNEGHDYDNKNEHIE